MLGDHNWMKLWSPRIVLRIRYSLHECYLDSWFLQIQIHSFHLYFLLILHEFVTRLTNKDVDVKINLNHATILFQENEWRTFNRNIFYYLQNKPYDFLLQYISIFISFVYQPGSVKDILVKLFWVRNPSFRF